jgi:oligopeptide/dipeptide ABC transporter ATP-binding protein
MTTLLAVEDLCVDVLVPGQGYRRAVSDLSLSISSSETVGLVGESGCGKTLTTLAALGLLPEPFVRQVSGSIVFDGERLDEGGAAAFRAIRGSRIGYVPQDPMNALNPVIPIGKQVVEAIRVHQKMSRRVARDRAAELLAQVGLPKPKERLGAYPHELSGGLRQRVLIAMALAGDPDLLIADEPTTALDVTIQAQVLQLLDQLRQDRAMALLLVSHDLAVVGQTCDRIVVLYAGQCVETGPTVAVLTRPQHPYTQGLLDSLPLRQAAERRTERLSAIPGTVPELGDWPTGCRFRDRCSRAEGLCAREEPDLLPVEHAGQAACHFISSGDNIGGGLHG